MQFSLENIREKELTIYSVMILRDLHETNQNHLVFIFHLVSSKNKSKAKIFLPLVASKGEKLVC